MPIPLKDFEEGKEPVAGQRSGEDYKAKITEFLTKNKKNAYTQRELASELGYEDSRTIRSPLVSMEKAKLVERKEVPTTNNGKTRDLQYWRWIGE